MSIPPYGAGRRDLTRLDEQRAAAPEPPAPDELAMLRADLADAEALIAKWPRCPAGCACRIGIEDDPDRNECGCDGPCNGGTARAALHDALRDAAGRIKRCTSAKPACTFCEADLAAVMEAADAYAGTAPELAALKPTDADFMAEIIAERDQARVREAQLAAALAVAEAERNDLRQALDERNAQHKALLDEFEVIDGLDGYQHGVAVLEATELAGAYRDAGYPVRDDLSHLAKP